MTDPDKQSPDRLAARLAPGRTIDACSAVLLPFDSTGAIDWASFNQHLARTADAGITPAINMDTGFGPQLTPEQRREVISQTADVMKGRRFIAGAGAFDSSTDPLQQYRVAIAEINDANGVPIVFQSAWLSAQTGADLEQSYRDITAGCQEAIAFELGSMFAPFGRIYTLVEYQRLLDIPAIVGAKHSSLSRLAELDRLNLRDQHRPQFKVYTGNDLAIDMVLYGSDYLLGLSTFDPEAFALRDHWWATKDARFYELNDALQALGAVAFRDPVPAYKHSAAVYLALTGQMPSTIDVHPACPRRPAWEGELLRPLAHKIDQAKRQTG